MAFIKICTCGERIAAESRGSFSELCPACGRSVECITAYPETDPRVAEQKPAPEPAPEPAPPAQETAPAPVRTVGRRFALRLAGGAEIDIPEEGGEIGRTGIGGEQLAGYPSVSRRHLRVTIRRNIGVMIEDISTYGTLVNGRPIEKNMPVAVQPGAKITLCDLETELIGKEADSE